MPLRLLLSPDTAGSLDAQIDDALGGVSWTHVDPQQKDADFEVAFVSRDVTGLSTKHDVKPATKLFYDALLAAPSLRWVHLHSAGADRPVYVTLRDRGVRVTTSSGVNAAVVAHSALAGILALARRLPLLIGAQRGHLWTPVFTTALPCDLRGQMAVIVGWGPIGQRIGAFLHELEMNVGVVRRSSTPPGEGIVAVPYSRMREVLPQADWLVLCCPLSEETRGFVDAAALSLLPPRAHVVNVSRGEVIDESALITALASGALAGAYLDVFEHEPLSADSPLWDMPNVLITPHSAGLSDGNESRVTRLFLDHLRNYGRRRMG